MSTFFLVNFPIVLIDIGTTCHIIINFVFNVHFHDISNIMLTIMVQHNLILKWNTKKKKPQKIGESNSQLAWEYLEY